MAGTYMMKGISKHITLWNNFVFVWVNEYQLNFHFKNVWNEKKSLILTQNFLDDVDLRSNRMIILSVRLTLILKLEQWTTTLG